MVRMNTESGRVVPTLLIVTSFLALVFMVATPSMENFAEEDRCQDVLGLIGRVEAACKSHQSDTGRPALEYAAKSEGDEFNAKRYHQLSARQLYQGWQGPYLNLGLGLADNPWGGDLQLRDNLSTHPALGFELGPGELAEERGQYLVLTQVPEDAARRIDSVLDQSGASSAWAISGRVEYVTDDGGTLSVYILKSNNEAGVQSWMPK